MSADATQGFHLRALMHPAHRPPCSHTHAPHAPALHAAAAGAGGAAAKSKTRGEEGGGRWVMDDDVAVCVRECVTPLFFWGLNRFGAVF